MSGALSRFQPHNVTPAEDLDVFHASHRQLPLESMASKANDDAHVATQKRFEEALSRFQAKLRPKEAREFEDMTSTKLEHAISTIQKAQADKYQAMNMPRVLRFVEAFKQFGELVEVFLNSSNYVAAVWGPMKLVLQIASNFAEAFDLLVNAYQEIGEVLPLARHYGKLFGGDAHFDEAWVSLYEDILEFHSRALHVFNRSMWKRFFKSAWKDFETNFKNTLANIRRHRDLLESNATALEYDEASQFRSKCRTDIDQLLTNRTDDHYRKVLQWLSTDDSDAQHSETCTVRLHGAAYALEPHDAVPCKGNSGQWIVQHPKLIAWLNEDFPKATTLWLRGIPGAGKTVLSSAIVEHCQAQSVAHASKTIYFYCRHGDPHRTTCIGVLRGLLRHLFFREHDLLSWCHDEYETSGELILTSEKLAIEMLRALLPEHQRTFMVIDGLDECGKDERMRLLKHIQSLQDIQDEGRLRILISSQVEPDIKRGLKAVSDITIRAEDLERDIRAYVADGCEVVGTRFGLSAAECSDTLEVVMKHVDGMFLYAKLVMKNLFHQPDKAGYCAEMAPGTFPEGLDEAYERIMQRLRIRWQHKREREAATNIFGWLTCAKRSLRLHEIQGALSIDVTSSRVDFDAHKLRQEIGDLCGAFISPLHGDRIELVHRTAKQYLIRSAWVKLLPFECSIAMLCLRYLTFECFDHGLPDDQLRGFLCRGYFAFADYAVAHWLDHLSAALIPPEPKLDDEVLAELLGNTEYGVAITEFCAVHHEEIAGDETIFAGDYSPYQALSHTAYYNDVLALINYHQKRPKQSTDMLDKIAPLGLADTFLHARSLLAKLPGTTGTTIEMTRHLEEFYGEHLHKCNRLRCFYFHEGFKDEKSLSTHLIRHEKPFKCTSLECTENPLFMFATRQELNRHMASHHPETGHFATSFVRLNKKQKTEPEVSPSKRMPKHPASFKCQECSKAFTRKSILDAHVRGAHEKKKPYKCTFSGCTKHFARPNDLARHRKTVHEKDNGKAYRCHGQLLPSPTGEERIWGCGRTFPRADALAAHYRTVQGKQCMQPLRDQDTATRKVDFNSSYTPPDSQQRLPRAVIEEYPELENLFLPSMEGVEFPFSEVAGEEPSTVWHGGQGAGGLKRAREDDTTDEDDDEDEDHEMFDYQHEGIMDVMMSWR